MYSKLNQSTQNEILQFLFDCNARKHDSHCLVENIIREIEMLRRENISREDYLNKLSDNYQGLSRQTLEEIESTM